MKPYEKAVRAGTTVFALCFLAFSVFLLSQIGQETRFSTSGKLFAQPRFWPAVGVIGMVGFGTLYLLTLFRKTQSGSRREILHWFRAIEYFLWFMAYVWLVPVSGYLAATVLFTVLLSLRQGYRSRRQLFIAGCVGVFIVLVFKTMLSVKIPGGAVYEFLPDALRNFMIVYF